MNVVVVWRDGFPVICTSQVDDIGWNFGDGDVVESLIESGMSCHFHPCGFGVMPECILCCARHMSKECPLARVRLEFCWFLARRSDPNSAPECSKVSEIFSFTSSQSDGGFRVQSPSENGILHLEGMAECARPEFW